jgi:hypothetical protein
MNQDDIEYNDYDYALVSNDYTVSNGYTMYRSVNTSNFVRLFIVILLILFGIPIALSGFSGLGSIVLLIWAYYKVKEWYAQQN